MSQTARVHLLICLLAAFISSRVAAESRAPMGPPTGSDGRSTSAAPLSPGDSSTLDQVSLLQYGAVPNCNVDSTDAINRGIAAAAAAGKTAYLPPGCYAHFSFIVLHSAKLMGAGDATELRATGGQYTYQVSSWSVDAGTDTITLNVTGNREIVPGSPMEVSGLTGFRCSGDPNGQQVASDAKVTFIRFRPKGITCSVGSGNSGSVSNKFPLTAVVMSGTGTDLRNIRVTTTYTGPRTGLNQSAAVLNLASNFVIDHVHLIGSVGLGYQCTGCSDGTESNDTVERTNADGMEHNDCAHDIKNFDNTAIQTGDDSFSVNSFQGDTCECHNITFTNDRSMNGHGRGFETDGGEDITFDGGSIVNPALPCLFFAGGTGGVFKMVSVSNIKVSGVTMSGCGKAAVYIGMGSGGFTASGITIDHVTATDIHGEGAHIGEPFGPSKDVRITDSTFQTVGGGQAAVTLVGSKGITLSGVNFNGFGKKCIAARGGSSPNDISPVGMTCDGNRISKPAEAVR